MSESVMSCCECQNLEKKILQELPAKLRELVRDAYLDAGMSGLCAEGQLEVALEAINEREIRKILSLS